MKIFASCSLVMLVLLCGCGKPAVKRHMWLKVEEGMTYSEVKSLIGEPFAAFDNKGPELTWCIYRYAITGFPYGVIVFARKKVIGRQVKSQEEAEAYEGMLKDVPYPRDSFDLLSSSGFLTASTSKF
ncbi:hypothetical protein N9004_02795 [Pirellulales bacterium]|nr:hypothetical protein [Pirellulales bacterium]